MAYPRRQATFRLSEQIHDLLDTMGTLTGLDRTATIERLIRAEAITMAKTEAPLAIILCKSAAAYKKNPVVKKAPGRKKKIPLFEGDDVLPPTKDEKRAAGILP